MFWIGAGVDEKDFNIPGEKFRDASVFYNSIIEIGETKLNKWLQKLYVS
ncbi:hypothetical protein [Marivirga harenae]|nr:hypothetical protein [Marivirga harenae]WKV13348.1 hypothetical protein Q3Y49_05845 [Marivirga harenae]